MKQHNRIIDRAVRDIGKKIQSLPKVEGRRLYIVHYNNE